MCVHLINIYKFEGGINCPLEWELSYLNIFSLVHLHHIVWVGELFDGTVRHTHTRHDVRPRLDWLGCWRGNKPPSDSDHLLHTYTTKGTTGVQLPGVLKGIGKGNTDKGVGCPHLDSWIPHCRRANPKWQLWRFICHISAVGEACQGLHTSPEPGRRCWGERAVASPQPPLGLPRACELSGRSKRHFEMTQEICASSLCLHRLGDTWKVAGTPWWNSPPHTIFLKTVPLQWACEKDYSRLFGLARPACPVFSELLGIRSKVFCGQISVTG